jgi:hypothetical protein
VICSGWRVEKPRVHAAHVLFLRAGQDQKILPPPSDTRPPPLCQIPAPLSLPTSVVHIALI